MFIVGASVGFVVGLVVAYVFPRAWAWMRGRSDPIVDRVRGLPDDDRQ